MGFMIDTSGLGAGLGILGEALMRRKEQDRASQYGQTSSLMRRLSDPTTSPAELETIKAEIAKVMRISDPQNIPSDVGQFINMLDTSLRSNFPEMNHAGLDAIVSKLSENKQLDNIYGQLEQLSSVDPEIGALTGILRDAGRSDLAVEYMLGANMNRVMGKQKAKDEAANYMLPESQQARAMDYGEKFDYQMRIAKEIELPMMQMRAALSGSGSGGGSDKDYGYAKQDVDEVINDAQELIKQGDLKQNAAIKKRNELIAGFNDPTTSASYEEDKTNTILQNQSDPSKNITMVEMIGIMDIAQREIQNKTGQSASGMDIMRSVQSKLTAAGYQVNDEVINAISDRYNSLPESTRNSYAELYQLQEEARAGYEMKRVGAQNLVDTSGWYKFQSGQVEGPAQSSAAMLKGNITDQTAQMILNESAPNFLPSSMPNVQEDSGQTMEQLKAQFKTAITSTDAALKRIAEGKGQDGVEKLGTLVYDGIKEAYGFGKKVLNKADEFGPGDELEAVNKFGREAIFGKGTYTLPGVVSDGQTRAQNRAVEQISNIIQSSSFNPDIEVEQYVETANEASMQEAGIPLSETQKQQIRNLWAERINKLKTMEK